MFNVVFASYFMIYNWIARISNKIPPKTLKINKAWGTLFYFLFVCTAIPVAMQGTEVSPYLWFTIVFSGILGVTNLYELAKSA